MSKSQQLQEKIDTARKNIAEWESELEELRQKEREAAVAEIKEKMNALGLTTEDIVGKRKARAKSSTNGRYYLLQGKKYPVRQGKPPKELSEYKKKFGNLTSILFEADGTPAIKSES